MKYLAHLHDGDRMRRRRRFHAAAMLAGVGVAGLLAARNWEPASDNGQHTARASAQHTEVQRLRLQLESARGELAMANLQLERWHAVFKYSRRFSIEASLAASIYDAALTVGVDPDLAFPLVKLESDFNERAVSPVGAVGLTQLMLGTAREYEKNVTREQLLDRHVNLRIGLRYLRDLIRENRGNVQLALLIYNRGPAAVQVAQELGIDPSNGYDRIVLRGYRGKGLID